MVIPSEDLHLNPSVLSPFFPGVSVQEVSRIDNIRIPKVSTNKGNQQRQ